MLNATHPTTAELLLAREAPSLPESRRIQEHVTECGVCRQTLSALESAEHDVADYCHTRAAQLPSPPKLETLRRRMQEEPGRRILAFPTTRGMVAAAALAACIVLAFYLRNPLQPESVEAAEVLRQATEHARAPGSAARPRAFEIRTSQRRFLTADAPNPRLAASLELAHVSWRDPLNPEDFARWRDAQKQKEDRVTRDSGWVRLTTTVLGDGPVRSASITVSRPDWRTIARTVEFRDLGPVEVREVSAPAPDTPRLDSMSPRSAETNVERPPGAEPDRSPDALEVRLWEALRQVDADVLDGGDVRRTVSGICYEVWPDEARRESVTAAVRAVVGTRHCASGTAAGRSARVLPPLATNAGSPAPFADALVKRFGDAESANRYVDQVLRQYVELLARVSALERLLRSFAPARFDALPQNLQARVRAIAAEHATAIRSGGALYLDAVAEGLRAALSDGELPAPPSTTNPDACQATARSTTSLASDLKTLQAGFNRLFGGGDGANPDTSAEVLLQSTVRHHVAVANRLAALCVGDK